MWRFLKRVLGGDERSKTETPSPHERAGFTYPEDSLARQAWISGSLTKMLAAMSKPSPPADRHFLLQTLVRMGYERRKEPRYAKICQQAAETHLAEIREIVPALEQALGVVPRITTFQHYATLLADTGRFDRAVEVCQLALELDLHDGTKSGFAGRIKRIRRAQERAQSGEAEG